MLAPVVIILVLLVLGPIVYLIDTSLYRQNLFQVTPPRYVGTDNFYYLFRYEDTRDVFGIPHDLEILREVFRCEDGDYAADNAYWRSYYLGDLMAEGTATQREAWAARVERLRSAYGVVSERYQSGKGDQKIPLG